MNSPTAPDRTGPGQEQPGHGLGATDLGGRVLLFWLLVTATVLVAGTPLPIRLVGAPLAIAAIWVGCVLLTRLGRARRLRMYEQVVARASGRVEPEPATPSAQRPGGPRPLPRSWPFALGLGLAAVLLANALSEAALYPLVAQREQCYAGANTSQAQEECRVQAEQRLRRMIEDLTGSPLPADR